MKKPDVKSPILPKKGLEAVGVHPKEVSVENVEKLTFGTKNGLVNGVGEEKSKTSKKPAKNNINTNVNKDSKKGKKGYNLTVQNNETNSKKSVSQKTEINSTKNCISNEEVSKEAKNKESLAVKNNVCHKEQLHADINELKPCQSTVKTNEPSSNKTESKRRKNKSKINKPVELNVVEQNDCNLPKFDIASIMTPTGINDSFPTPLLSLDTPSTSKLDTRSSYMDYEGSPSSFERNLIESIKNLQIQNESKVATEKENVSETKQDVEETTAINQDENICDITYVQYESELQMPMIMKIIQKDLSEPYSIYTYRYFIHNWPKLCFLAMCEDKCVGAIVCKLDFHRKSTKRGYIAMLAVDKDYRKRKIGSTLVRRAITEMIVGAADEVVLETEVTNKPALRLYEQLGFVRDKRLFRYYLNGVDALRLKLWLR